MRYGSLNKSTSITSKLIILLVITAFGPYIIPQAGIRIEHFFIYGIFLYTFLCFLSGKSDFRLNRYAAILLILFSATVIWIFAVSYLQKGLGNIYGLVASIENFTQPIALIFILTCFLKGLDKRKIYQLFRIVIFWIIVMLCINSIIAIGMIFFDIWAFLKYFVLSDSEQGGRGSVLERAASMGRFSGIFNQPFESGLAYSIGLLCWVYLATNLRTITFSLWTALTLLLIGGTLSMSKVFLMAGFPLSLFYLLWNNVGYLKIRKSTVVGGIFWFLGTAALAIFIVSRWQGLNRFLDFFSLGRYAERGVISSLTAGRFGQESSAVKSKFLDVWLESPLFGLGAPIPGLTDNAYLEFFYYGGSVGLLLNILMLLVIGVVSYTGLRNSSEIGKFIVVLWVLIIGAGLGAPVLTINRSSIFLWIILVFAFHIVSQKAVKGRAQT